MNYPILKQQNRPQLSFPHLLDERGGVLQVIYNPESPMKVGDEFYMTAISKDRNVVTEIKNIRPANGDWSAYDFNPHYCEVTYL